MGGTVMVTGAGGSIGSALVKRIIQTMPVKRLVLLELSEYNLYRVQEVIEEVLESTGQTVDVLYFLADVRHSVVIESIFEKTRPVVVFHTAALKHVPILEYEHNALEGIRTNILGTWNVARYSIRFGVKQFVLISTDKAVNPISMMGATKTFAEKLCQEMSYSQSGLLTVFTVVRFGNVQGSSGSVLPKFQSQIEKGGPVTVTDKQMMRYFMSIEEAVGLVVDSARLSQVDLGVFHKYIFNMGEPVKIIEIAQQLIKVSGKKIAIKFTGVRPGEKLFEELYAVKEKAHPIKNTKLIRIKGGELAVGFIQAINPLQYYADMRDFDSCLEILKQKVNYVGGVACHSL